MQGNSGAPKFNMLQPRWEVQAWGYIPFVTVYRFQITPALGSRCENMLRTYILILSLKLYFK